MAKRWIMGGVWVVLASAGLLACGRSLRAEKPAMREKPNIVRKVTFLGAKHIKDEELRKIVGINPGMPLNPKLNRQGCQKILAKYE